MIFLNWLLALGALAFTVPLAIHLLFRHRFEIVDWGAMRFLESVVRLNRKRLKLLNLLLLLIRCSIPILLAFCLARPVITGWKSLPGDEPVAMVLVLDTSHSLASAIEGQSSNRFQRVVNSAEAIVTALPRGSDVILVTSAKAGQDDETGSMRGDPQETLATLQSLKIGGRPLVLEAVLSEAIRKLSETTTERRQIVMISDQRASDFSQSLMDDLRTIGERVATLTPRPTIAWVDAWKDLPAMENNRRIIRLEPTAAAGVPGQKVLWNVEARLDGDAAITTSLAIVVDGESIESKPVEFRGGAANLSFETVFERPGHHVVQVALPAEDGFSPDDSQSRNFIVYPPLEVWLVDGTPSDKPLQSDTDYLAIALSPFSLAGERAVDLFRTVQVLEREMDAKKDSHPKLVVLADVGTVSPTTAKWLTDFVENQGGVLVCFAGPATDGELWDKQLLMTSGTPMLPMAWGSIENASEGTAGFKIDDKVLTYPPLASFAMEAKGTLGSVDVFKYRKLTKRVSSDESKVVMRLQNGDPLLVVSSVGKGQIMQVATTANDRWTSLPRRLAFVPLVQRLFMHLATGENQIVTPEAGEPIVLGLESLATSANPAAGPVGEKGSTTDSKNAPAGITGKWQVSTPEGVVVSVPIESNQLKFTGTYASGTYRFSSDQGDVAYSGINVPEAELKLTAVEANVRDDATNRIGAIRYASVTEYQNDDSTRRFGRGIWRYLLIALLAALIIEPFVQQRGARLVS